MAYGFRIASGGTSNTTDRIATGWNVQTTNRTYFVQYNRFDTGASGTGRLLTRGTGSAIEGFVNNSSGVMRFARGFGASNSQWSIGDANTTGTWLVVALSHDGSDRLNDPIASVNGNSSAIGLLARSGSGSLTDPNTQLVIGNDAGFNTGFGGLIGTVAIWSRLFTQDELNSLTASNAPLLFPNGLAYYNPNIRETQNLIAASTHTITGATVRDHPRINFPYA